jgi:O-antigen/teichoic acid export membrane protein
MTVAQASRVSARRHLVTSGAVLAAATVLANVFGYALVLVLSRTLGPAEYGAVGALINLTVIGTVPALAVQLVAARETARLGGRLEHSGALVRLGLGAGALLSVLVVAAAGPLDRFLHLDGPVPAVALGLSLLPATAVAAVQGVLQGAERFRRLAVLVTVVGATRFVAGASAAVAGWGVTGVMVATAVAAVLAAAVAVVLLPSARPWRSAGGRPAPLWRQVGTSSISTAGLLILVNVDVLLARHYLPPAESGLYAVGSIFTKVTFWGPQFVATLLFARMATESSRVAAVRYAVVTTAALGGVGVVVAAAGGAPLVRLVAGAGYGGLGRHAALFAALGTTLAVVQVLVYAALAVGDRRLGLAAWPGAALTCLAVATVGHGSPTAVVSTVLAGTLGLAAVGLLLTARLLGRADRPPPEALLSSAVGPAVSSTPGRRAPAGS